MDRRSLPESENVKRVAVIAGAGPAGLTAAWELMARTDVRPIVIEPTLAIGGIARTHVHNGNRMDIGGHRFFSKSERVMKWWFSILPPQGAPAADDIAQGHVIDLATEVVLRMLTPLQRIREEKRSAPDPECEDRVMLHRSRLSRIYFARHFFPYPLIITMTVAWRLGLVNTALIALSYLWAKVIPRRDETYLDAFFINRFGKRLYETFFHGYTEKVWGVKCSEIRADWGAQRIKGLSLKRAVAHAIRDLLSSDFRKQQHLREISLITRFWYPKLGPGQMWETVAEQIRSAGGEIRHGARVVSVQMRGGRVWQVRVQDESSGQCEDLPCDYFFSTMPVRELVAMALPKPPAAVQEVAAGLCYRDFLTVGILLDRLHVLEKGKLPQASVHDNWIYVQDAGVRVGRIQIFNNWSPYLAADHERTTWIGLEYFVSQGDDLWGMPDEDLVRLAVGELERIGFAQAKAVRDSCVLRVPHAYPAYFGSYGRFDEIRRWANSIPNLFCIGRNGMHRYNNQDHSMLTAMMAVDNIVAGHEDDSDIWNVNMEAVYGEKRGT
jgi:protoporphyrinogen oxidase